MSSQLLSLPRELRDQVIEHVILFRKKPPKNPAHETESRLNLAGQGALRPPAISRKTYTASGLLGTNAQLRTETQDRLKQLKVTYMLDVMVVDHEIWPTWTCCPARVSGPLDGVNITLRFFSNANDPYMVQVARTCGAILQGRKWASTSLHPLVALFMHVRSVCLQPGSNDENQIKMLRFDASTGRHLGWIAVVPQPGPLSNLELNSVFGKHRSLWNSFRSIYQYPFAGTGENRRLDLVASLRTMVLLYLQEAWEDECGAYASYVGPLGHAFRSVQDVLFVVDGQDLRQLTSSVLTV